MQRALVLTLGAAVAFMGAVEAAGLKDDEVEKIMAAVPNEAPAKPAAKRKVLLYSHCNGFVHGGAIEAAKVAFPAIAQKTKAFDVVVSDDLNNFDAGVLSTFDAVILSNTTGDLFVPKGNKTDADKARAERLRQNLADWVKRGGGLMGIHAATDCSYNWKEYGDMMGGYFTGHPWNENVFVKNDDPDHPINAGFEGQGFRIHDEIYQFNRGIYSRDKQRVLLSLDMGEGKTPRKGQRADQDYAVSWVKTHGKGKVFYCSLGHERNIFMEPMVLKHYLAGLQFVMGDLEADTTPVPLKQ